jgi:hypothetical protein
MKLLYEAQNSLEAHMILHMLEQAGLSARIDGEYLQGGIGDLQAIGLVRVMVEDTDYAEGKSIIQEWDAKQPEQAGQKHLVKKGRSYIAGPIGLAFGVVAMAIYYNTPITDDGIDYDGDGKFDEKWTYVNYLPSKAEIDRNRDGKIDLIYSYDRKGLIKSSSSDEDFNGMFETEVGYERGNPVWQKSDTTGDGFKDYRTDFKHGVAEKVSFIDPVTKRVRKVQEYSSFMLKSAKVDSTGDGVLDTFYEYDSIEEIAKRSNK